MVSLSDLPVRADLRDQHPYGAPQVDVPIRLNTNENPFAPSRALVDAIAARTAAAALTLNRYPDRDAIELRRRLAHYVTSAVGADVNPGQVWVANGSNEILQQLLQAFGGADRTALGFEPSYTMHRLICRGTGTTYVSADRSEGFSLSVNEAVSAVATHSPDVIFLCSPNNPTGTSVEPDALAAIYDAAPGLVIVDEAYGEFSRLPSAVLSLPDRPRLVVVRTMSKAFALAGARVGYVVADPGVIDALQLVRLPYHLSSVTQAVALAALEHAEELLAHVDHLKHQRDRIVDGVGRLGYEVVGSDANFVFFRVGDQVRIWQELLDQGVLVRDVGVPGYLRVSAGTSVETTGFLEAIERITKENVA